MKKAICLLLVLSMMLGLCACGMGKQKLTGNEVIVTDMIGREVAINPGTYQRVVCIGAGALRMYSYIGDVSLLCGVEDIDNTMLADRPKMFDSVARPYMLAYGDVFKTLPSCGVGGPMAQAAEAEKILSCNPDVVISEFEDVDKGNALQEQLGIPVITLKAGSKGVFDEAFAGSMELLGKVFRKEAKATALVEYVKDQQNQISQRVANIPEEEKPNVYICGLGNWGTTDHLTTAENYVSFEIAGVKNVLSGTGLQGVGPIEEEKFVELSQSMDIMIVDAAAIKNIKPLYAEDPTMFDTCKAWQEGQVYQELAYNAYYTNFEIALANTWFIAKMVYPELFEDINMTEKTNEITGQFLGQELADEIFTFGTYSQLSATDFE